MEILSLLESASRTLATNKLEMAALLNQWKSLAEKEKGSKEYPEALNKALKVLNRSASLPEFLAKLRKEEQQEPKKKSTMQ